MTQNKNRDQYFMEQAIKASLHSDDPNTKVGAVFVKNNQIISKGWNHFPINAKRNSFPKTNQAKDWLKTKYPYIIHAEMHAVSKLKTSLKNAKLYVTLFPCNECIKNLSESGLKEIIYLADTHAKQPAFIASKKIIKACQIPIRQLKISK